MEILAPVVYAFVLILLAILVLLWRRQRAWREAQRQQRAIEEARAYAESHPDEPEAWFRLACRCVEAGELSVAVRYYEETLTRAGNDHPLRVEALNHLGNLCDVMGEPEQALEYYRRGLEIQPHHADLHFNLGTLYLNLGDWDRAEEHLRAYILHDPSGSWGLEARRLLEGLRRSRRFVEEAQDRESPKEKEP